MKLEAKIVDQFHEMFILEARASVDGKKMARAEAKYVEPRYHGSKSGEEMTSFSAKALRKQIGRDPSEAIPSDVQDHAKTLWRTLSKKARLSDPDT